MSEAATQETDLLGEPVSYEVRRSDEATQPRIDVHIHGVTVVLPQGAGEDAESLLSEHANWVIEKKRKFDSYRADIPDRRYESGATFPYLGEPHEVVVETRPSSEVEDGALRLDQHHVEQKSVKRALETLYRRKARERFEERANHFAAEMDVEHEQIEIRNQRTKWGSCSTTGTIGLNWRLMMAPPEIVEYVVVHELAHLRESNHGEEFWSLVAEHDPDYEAHAEWLEEHSTQLIFTTDDV